ncbi:uncharacterized protein A4U43_C04F35610 [Asparagus officinalis]|uniref:Uncharacterized protein n=1 Tax=Asparagus officinalis TaxID=4686 RepID=A0A5P1FAK4_ASPOF|nr:uncharacterized protein LOC109839658 [Asparagus officinalis]XP_020263762.1 uncharacterized protein LOC109839658 [Asparagus officinalis]ONK73809.1 uncharacterized protein A4U43_C04F35610 [Asparagus officinalis]
MSQRRAAAVSGRPSGTDGSDFSYRMVVDSRYTKVAKGKLRLKALIAAQAFSQVIGCSWLLLSASEEMGFNRFAIISSSIGFISVLIGELGRRHSRGILLRLYTIISCIATAFSVACVVRTDSFVKAIQYKNASALANYELVEVVRVLLGVMLQIFVIVTTNTLVQNMSPPKRAS